MPLKAEPLTPELAAKIVDRKIGIKGTGHVLLLGDSMLGGFLDQGSGKGILNPSVFENAAIGGTKVCHWLYLLKENPDSFLNLELLQKIDFFIICVGTNDLADPTYNPEDVASGIIEVVRLLHKVASPNAQIRFLHIFPRYDIRPTTINEEIVILNHLVSMQSVSDVPSYKDTPLIMDRQYYEADNLHFSREGYKVLATKLQEMINK